MNLTAGTGRCQRGARPARLELVRLEMPRQHAERLEQVVRPPDELVAGGEVDALRVAATVEDAARVQVALAERAHGGLGGRAVLLPLLRVLLGGRDLQEGRRRDGRGRGVVLGVRRDWGVEVPV